LVALKSGKLLLSVFLTGAIMAAGSAVVAQPASDSAGFPVIPFFDRPIDPDIYLIRPGEQLEVIFINAQLGPLALTVDAESRIVHRKLGILDLSGRTLSDARQLLLAPLARLYNADKIDISIRGVYPVSIQVTGAVRKPGRYVGYTSQKVGEIVDSAGGVTSEGSTRDISFISGDRKIPVDLDRARRLGDSSPNPNLYAGNRIHVPVAPERKVYVIGEVNDPRSIELLPGDNLELLVALAGGVRPGGDMSLAYVISDSTRDIRTEGGIRAGDFIVIPRSATAVGDNDFTILGAVRSPGRYPWKRGTTIEDLLRISGGLTDRGNAQRIVVFRQARDVVLGTPLKDRFPLYPGGSNSTGGLALEPADSVVVAALVGYVRVSGEVTNPGVYPFEPGKNAGYYLSLAGGVVSGPEGTDVLLHDPVSNLTRAGETRDPVSDGLEIIVRQQEPGQ
jgi:protein involved in polysaccharide export with SLBB domain